MSDFKLPLVGLGTCYCEFSKENPDAGVRRHRGGLRRLLETELAMARCEFDKLKGYYEELDMKSSLAWIRQFLRVPRGYPEWMVRMNLTQIPEEWKRQCAYLGVHGKSRLGDYVW